MEMFAGGQFMKQNSTRSDRLSLNIKLRFPEASRPWGTRMLVEGNNGLSVPEILGVALLRSIAYCCHETGGWENELKTSFEAETIKVIRILPGMRSE